MVKVFYFFLVLCIGCGSIVRPRDEGFVGEGREGVWRVTGMSFPGWRDPEFHRKSARASAYFRLSQKRLLLEQLGVSLAQELKLNLPFEQWSWALHRALMETEFSEEAFDEDQSVLSLRATMKAGSAVDDFFQNRILARPSADVRGRWKTWRDILIQRLRLGT